MSKKWYPIVDDTICEECGTCVGMCPHAVYDLEKSPAPLVVNGDGCFEGCHGCGSRCPAGAITYAGDETGWTPPNSKKDNTDSCGCENGCSGESDSEACGCGSGCAGDNDCRCN